jgi:two-component system, response regulator, stage 0 sporulation protein F
MCRILVVDDDPAVLSCYGKLLTREGHEVRTAPGGEIALSQIKSSGPYDIIVIDYRMPGMDGIEFLRRLRSQGRTPEVILVSAYANEDVRKRAAAMGVRLILSKPIDVTQFRAAIREASPPPPAATQALC